MSIDIENLLETTYKTEKPELLGMYHIDIEHESHEDGSWYGKLWIERPDGTAYPFLAVSNAGTGSVNKYNPITSNEDRRHFMDASNHAFPQAVEPADMACVYLELRQAKQDLDNE